MPVSEASGIAGTLNLGGGSAAQSPLQGFAEQLLKAKEMQRQAALSSIEAATKIAEHDPVMAEEIGGKALKDLGKHTGQTSSEMYFKNIYDQAQKNRAHSEAMAGLEEKKGAAEIPKIDAETRAALAKAGYDESEAGLNKLKIDTEQSVQADEKALENPDLDPAVRAQKAIHVATYRNLPAETTDILMMDPKHRAAYLDAKSTKATQESLEAELKTAAFITDFRDDKGNTMTPSQADDFVKTGKLPAGFESPERQKIVLEARRVAAEERSATATQKRVQIAEEAERAASLERTARAFKELADAEYRLKQGDKTSLEEVLKGFQSAREAKLAGKTIDPKITEELEKELGARFGLEQTETKSLFGLWTSKGYAFVGGPADPKATEDEKGTKGPQPSAQGMGSFVTSDVMEQFIKTLPKDAMNILKQVPRGPAKFAEMLDEIIKGTEPAAAK